MTASAWRYFSRVFLRSYLIVNISNVYVVYKTIYSSFCKLQERKLIQNTLKHASWSFFGKIGKHSILDDLQSSEYASVDFCLNIAASSRLMHEELANFMTRKN